MTKPKFVVPTVNHYNVICPKCKVTNVLYYIPMAMQTKCVYCKYRIILLLPRHNMGKEVPNGPSEG